MKFNPVTTDSGVKSLRITPENEFENAWLMEFIGGGGPADDWQFLEHTDRRAEFRVNGISTIVQSLDIAVHKIK